MQTIKGTLRDCLDNSGCAAPTENKRFLATGGNEAILEVYISGQPIEPTDAAKRAPVGTRSPCFRHQANDRTWICDQLQRSDGQWVIFILQMSWTAVLGAEPDVADLPAHQVQLVEMAPGLAIQCKSHRNAYRRVHGFMAAKQSAVGLFEYLFPEGIALLRALFAKEAALVTSAVV